MTPNPDQTPTPNIQRSLSELMTLPAFQNLLAKVETNFYRNQPNEAQRMEQDGTLPSFLQAQTVQAWEILSDARMKGMTMQQAEELIGEFVYPPLEKDEL
jgi:hypothetical protein